MTDRFFLDKSKSVRLPLFAGLLSRRLCGFPVLLLGRVPALFKCHWTDAVQRLMQSFAFVKVQPVNHLVHGRSTGGKSPACSRATFRYPHRLSVKASQQSHLRLMDDFMA